MTVPGIALPGVGGGGGGGGTTDHDLLTNRDLADQHPRGAIESGWLAVNTTYDLLLTDTTIQKQAKIDAVPRSGFPGVIAIFQFEDGTHAETASLDFRGFAYKTYVQGNDSEDEFVNHTNQAAVLSFAAGGILIDSYNTVVRNLKIVFDSASGENGIEQASGSGYMAVNGCFTLGNSTADGSGIKYAGVGGSSYALEVSNSLNGQLAQETMVLSRNCDDTDTPPVYGLTANQGSKISKMGPQATGSTSNDNEGTTQGARII